MSEAEQPLQEHEVTGVMSLDVEAKTVTVGKITVSLSHGLWANVTQSFYTNDYVKVSYVEKGDVKVMRSIARV